MKFLDKLLITILSLFAIFLSFFFIIISIKIISPQYLITSLSVIYGRWETGVSGLVLLILCFSILFNVLKSKRLPETIVRDSELGKVCITLSAVESIVQKVLKDLEDVKESRIYIKKQEDGVSITLKITVNFDVIIPELTSELQTTIKNYVESTAGISVKNVSISVNNVSNQVKQKQ